jgi:hypothetical protein
LVKLINKGGFAVTKSTTTTIEFTRCKRRKVNADFGGGEITSDAGVMLLSEVDKKLNLTQRIGRVLNDPRCQGKCKHSLLDLLRQRVYALALGYEDLSDHYTLRTDTALQTAVGRDTDLGSSSTLCRFENRVDADMLWQISTILVDVFIESFKKPPKELILDFDCTDDPVHGHQIGRFFHGYYDCHCFLPLYVFSGKHLLGAYLRPSNIDPAKGAWAILKLLSDRFRQLWPDVRIVFRADSGFCRHRMFNWCDRNDIDYIVGIAKNDRLLEKAQKLMDQARLEFTATSQKQRLFADLQYGAHSWKYTRRVIVKAEHNRRGSNPRFVVTNISGQAGRLYDQLYCARGEAENRIKEQQLDLFSDRTSCMNWLPNQMRVLLSAVAYTLIEAIRRLALYGTHMASARCQSIRLKLLKIGAVITRNTRRVRLMLSSAYPYQHLFITVAGRLKPT